MAEATLTPPAPTAAPAAASPAPATPANAGAQGVQSLPPNSAIPAPLQPLSKPRSAEPDSHLNKARQRLEEKVSGKKPEPPKPKETSKPEPAKAAEPAENEAEPQESDPDLELLTDTLPGNSQVEPKAKDGVQPAAEAKPKVNPWKLKDEWKSKAEKYEAELAEVRRLVPDTAARKAELAEFESIKKRATELEEIVKFKDYKESAEYKDRYEKPLHNQWARSLKDLKNFKVMDGEGGSRLIDHNDLLKLVNLPADEALKAAEGMFDGSVVGYVMSQRDKIRDLHDESVAAQEDARREGMERSQTEQRQIQQHMEQVTNEVSSTYQKAVSTFENDPKMAEFFKPIDGDDEANAILQKGYALVDEAFKLNPMDPNLTKEQRASIVKKHAAMRHRSAGFGRARYLLAKERADHVATKKKLAEFEGTVPSRGISTPQSAPNGKGSAMDRAIERLMQRSKR